MTTTTDRSRWVHVEPCMGTVFTIDIRDPGDWTDATEAAVAWLHHVDAVFSTYRPDSDISRLQRGEAALDDLDPQVSQVLTLCARMSSLTGGYFSARSARGLDPTGIVKGWAIEQASGLLRRTGSHNHAVNGGGDMQLAGTAGDANLWRVGISDPGDRTRVVATVEGRDLAVATSGISERGPHIVNPFTGAPPDGVASVTVVGASLSDVDVYATAAFAMGEGALSWLDALPDHEGLVVTSAGDCLTTRGFGRVGVIAR